MARFDFRSFDSPQNAFIKISADSLGRIPFLPPLIPQINQMALASVICYIEKASPCRQCQLGHDDDDDDIIAPCGRQKKREEKNSQFFIDFYFLTKSENRICQTVC